MARAAMILLLFLVARATVSNRVRNWHLDCMNNGRPMRCSFVHECNVAFATKGMLMIVLTLV